jgi:hypothetical protein
MMIAGVHEVIAGIALIIARLFVGYDGPKVALAPTQDRTGACPNGAAIGHIFGPSGP